VFPQRNENNVMAFIALIAATDSTEVKSIRNPN